MLRLKYRFLVGLVPLISVGALYGWTATPAPAATQPGGTPILDNFNRANENPLSGGGNWSKIPSIGGAQLLNNAVASSGSTTSGSLWHTSYSNDIEVRATALISTNNVGLYTEATVDGNGKASGYLWQWQGANSPATFALYRADADVLTTLATFNGFSLDPGDQIALQVIGGSVEGWVYHLGSWQQVASATDTTYRTGQIGVRPRGTTPIIDDFGGGPVQASQQTIVSLTFDDALSDQSVVPSMLAADGMHGTFYVNSGNIGSTGFLGWSQLQSFQSAGDEIAGHTINHVDLTTVSLTEAQRQVCQDRRALMSEALNVTDFAYPYGAYHTSVESIVQGCGYNSARRSWGLCSPAQTGCGAAETIPPQDVYAIRTQSSIRSWTTVQDLENAVMSAEATGGWITFVFHHICDGCDSYAITQSNLQAFLDWLQPRSPNGTVVKTVHDVIGGPLQPPPTVADQTPPTSSIACNSSTCSSGWYTAPVSVSLSSVDSDTGVAVIRYTTDGSDPTAFSPIYSAPFTVGTTTTVKYRAWDNAGNIEATQSQLISVDKAAPTSSIACNGGACSSGWYASAVTVTLSAVDSGGSGVAAIRYTTDGSDPSTTSTVYTGSFSISSTTTVKYRAWDNAGNVEATNSQLIQIDTTPPTSSIACNSATCSSGWYTAPVSVSLSTVDSGGSGVAFIRYTTDGSDPSLSSPVYSTPFTVSSTTTVKYRAWDNAGNIEATQSQLISVDTAAPMSLIACNSGTCSSGWYASAVTVTLWAIDSGGSGVAAIRYTTDGSDPSTTSTVYSSSFSISSTTTVKFRAWDNAGNVEATNSQLIQVDTTPPTSSIACNGSSCSSGWYTAPVSVSLSAVDSGGSGVAFIRYTTDGSDPSLSSPVYSAPLTVSSTTTVKYRAWDNAGNAEATNAQLIRIDTTAPQVTLTNPVNGATVSGVVRLQATASDTGSGVVRVDFYVDNKLVGTATSAPYQVNWNTNNKQQVARGSHTIYAVAVDRAGNSRATTPITVTVV